VESPTEDSDTSQMSFCGQGTTIPFYVTYHHQPQPQPDPWPKGNDAGLPWSQQNLSWDRDWTYRRVDSSTTSVSSRGQPGETTVINVEGGNDLANAYVLLPTNSAELKAQLATPGAWRGGLNLTTLAQAEQRAYGFYHWFLSNASSETQPYLALNASLTGTATGLSKMPYLRDTRRAVGIKGFRMFSEDVLTPDPIDNRTTVEPFDAIAIGQYFYADIHQMTPATCPYPDYIVNYISSGKKVLPYFIPFRALTVDGAPNLLVAGKTMAATFLANAALRLHPEEWSSGVAAGVSAAMMSMNGWSSTAEALVNVKQIQERIQNVGSPLSWTF
jgi:hypothetical protein